MWNKVMNLIETAWTRLTFKGEPSPKCWVFSSVHNQTFNYNSAYLFLYVKDHCPDIQPYYVINDEGLRKELEKRYGKGYFIDTGTLAGIRKVLSCKVWFTSTAPPLYGAGFRKKYVIINLWHGVPLKKIGMEQENLSWFTKKYYKYLFADNYKAVLTTSRELIPVMSRSFLVEPERIKVWGQPRNDCMFQKKDACKVIRNIYGEKQKAFKKIILYAPTFREDGPTRIFPFTDFDMERMQEWLEKQEILLCIRLHLYDRTNSRRLKELDHPGSRIRLLNEDRAADIMEILNIFDLLITDYSSIYIDYLFTGHPIVFLPYDKEEYLKDRGMNFSYEAVTPGPKPKTFDEFLNSLHELLYNHDSYVQQREEIHGFFNEIQSPCCADICKHTREITDRRE